MSSRRRPNSKPTGTLPLVLGAGGKYGLISQHREMFGPGPLLRVAGSLDGPAAQREWPCGAINLGTCPGAVHVISDPGAGSALRFRPSDSKNSPMTPPRICRQSPGCGSAGPRSRRHRRSTCPAPPPGWSNSVVVAPNTR